MKRHTNLFHRVVSLENVEVSARKAMRGKKWQHGVVKFLENEKGNVWGVYNLLKTKTFTTSEYKVFTIMEKKERVISRLPFYPDRVVQHCLMNVLEPIFYSLFTEDTYSCIKGRGIHKASYDLRKALSGGVKYCLKLDIKKFYPSVDNTILKKMLRRKFKDVDLLWLIDDIIDSAEGLPLGNITSQFFANFYLSYFDRWVKEKLRIKWYFRYADDIVILSNDKTFLHNCLKEIKEYLRIELNLEVKRNHQVFPVADRGIDWVGYVHFHNHTMLRKSIKQNYKKNRVKSNYNGWLVHADTINLRRKYENNKH